MTAADGAVLGTLVTVVVGAFVTGIVKIMGARHENTETTAKRSLDEAFRLIELKSKENTENRDEIHKLRNDLQELVNHKNKCEIDLALAEERQANTQARVEYLEEILRQSGHNVPIIKMGNGSKVHATLPKSKPSEG